MKDGYLKTMLGRSGLSLVELLVALLISFIVFSAWMKICNIQAVRKESLRFEAVERAAGILDMIDVGNLPRDPSKPSYYSLPIPFNLNTRDMELLSGDNKNKVWALFTDQDTTWFPIGYRIKVDVCEAVDSDWGSGVWVFMELYDRHSVTVAEAGQPFTMLKVLIKR